MKSPETEPRQDGSDLNRARNQAERILAMLRLAGSRGCTNTELFVVCHALNARVNDLRQRGYRIEARREGGGVWRYTLVGEPASSKPLATRQTPPQTPATLSLFSAEVDE